MIETYELPNSRVVAKVKHQERVVQCSLLDLVRGFCLEEDAPFHIYIPDHQRRYIWSADKERGLIDDVTFDRLAPNMLTFAFFDPLGPLFVTDGLQRLSALKNLYQNPEKYGTTKNNAREVLSKTFVAIWVKFYDDPMRAVEDFAKSQLQTQCTAYEQCFGIFTVDKEYRSDYKSRLDRLKDVVANNLAVLTKNALSDERSWRHKAYRNDFALFYRFVTQDRSLYDWKTNANSIPYKDIKQQDYIEAKLRLYFQITRFDKTDQLIKNFDRFLKDITSLIETEWQQIAESPTKNITETLLRHFYDVAIYCRNNGINTHLHYREYVKTILEQTQGEGSVLHPVPSKAKDNKKFIFKIDGVAQLKEVERAYHIGLIIKPAHKRKNHRSAGTFHNGHIVSHHNGGEKVKPQDPFENRHLGKNNMDDADENTEDFVNA